jgi:hypothetical protein
MTLHRALIWGMEKGRGQEALARSLTPNRRRPMQEVKPMADSQTYPDSVRPTSGGLRHAV